MAAENEQIYLETKKFEDGKRNETRTKLIRVRSAVTRTDSTLDSSNLHSSTSNQAKESTNDLSLKKSICSSSESVISEHSPKQSKSKMSKRSPKRDRPIERSISLRRARSESNERSNERSKSLKKSRSSRRESSPTGRERSPKRREGSPMGRERSPKRRESSPTGRERSPKRRESSPKRRESSPKSRERSPKRRERSTRRERSPKRRERSSTRERSPARRERASRRERSSRKERSSRRERSMSAERSPESKRIKLSKKSRRDSRERSPVKSSRRDSRERSPVKSSRRDSHERSLIELSRRSIAPKRRSRPRTPQRSGDRSSSESLRRTISTSRSMSPRTPSSGSMNNGLDFETEFNLFEELDISNPILYGIQTMNIIELNRFQKAVLPALLRFHTTDFYIQAKPSFGKKICYLIAALQHINPSIRSPQALIVVPSSDLALRLSRIAKSVTYYSKIETRIVINDFDNLETSIDEQLIICTSGVLHHNLKKYRLFDLSKIRVVIYDEFPILTASEKSHFYIRELLSMKNDCQLIFFSANFDNLYEKRMIKRFTNNLHCINLLDKEECFSSLHQYYVMCRDMHDKNKALDRIFGHTSADKAIVFVSDKRGATYVANCLHHKGFKTFLLTSDLTVNDRLSEVRDFDSTRDGILILTYPLSIGLDLSNVYLVVNFDLPLENENFYFEYFYRVEECTRANRSSCVINLVDGQSARKITKIENYYGIRMQEYDI